MIKFRFIHIYREKKNLKPVNLNKKLFKTSGIYFAVTATTKASISIKWEHITTVVAKASGMSSSSLLLRQ